MPPKRPPPKKSNNNNNNNNNNANGNAAASHPQNNIGFLPPGASHPQSRKQPQHQDPHDDDYSHHSRRQDAFENRFEPHFPVPARLQHVPSSLVEAVNDFHFAMMNDNPRNAFYYHLLKQHIVPGETGVLEIGAGSGLLSMMAARLGAKWVVAVEGSYEMSQLAKRNVKQNHLEDKVRVMHMLSTDLQKRDLPATPDVLVSEIFGTLLLGESALDYIVDVRQRGIIDAHKTAILPQRGVQYAVPLHSDTLSQICTVEKWRDLNLSQVTRLQDSCSVVFTKQYGFRLSSMPYTYLSTAPVELLRVDFKTSRPQDYKQQFPVRITAREDGTAQAWLLYWVAEHDVLPPAAPAKALTPEEQQEEDKDLALILDKARNVYYMSTKPEDTKDNFPRDMQWGQALQLIDCTKYVHSKKKAEEEAQMPSYLPVKKGATYEFVCSLSQDRVVMHLQYKREVEAEKKAEQTPAEEATETTETKESSGKE